jgi:histidinol-phosphate aminotransferase
LHGVGGGRPPPPSAICEDTMTLSRRGFVRQFGVGAVGSLVAPGIAGRGLEALVPGRVADRVIELPPKRVLIRLDSNENPNGPGPAPLEAIRAALYDTPRYPDDAVMQLQAAVAELHGTDPYHVRLGCGSTDVLRACVQAFTSPTRALVTGAPSYESPSVEAERVGAPVKAVRVTADLTLDLDGMADAARGAGLVYLCNPNNPTATVQGGQVVRTFIDRVLRETPEITVLVDEAYHEYVDDPGYATMVPLALEHPRVIVARTFSKVYGMAGLRVGYALGRPATMNIIERHILELGVNALGAAAATAALKAKGHVAREQARNRAARDFTRKAFEDLGYACGPSETNFVMVDVKRDPRAFRAACRDRGVMVGRPFPPLETQARITIGTMDEMRRAMPIFKEVLASA